ncbi:MAG: ABC transporter ATP-binding protein [Coxiellaceae bacterium]|jgi:putative ABC transport system ATP-binding protein|nr:ABC transporter ATP-binding protein [Coxiellaceae bacterium]
MTSILIALKNLNKNYLTPAGSQEVLKNINLSIVAGEFIALMGPSGSGKSTLMNILGCLDLPTSGHYFLNGEDASLLSEDQQARLRNRTIGFIFQGFNLLQRVTLENNVMLPMIYARVSKSERLKRAKSLLEKVGLGHRLSATPNEISGGEQQRVAIARALANYPKLILADEPTGNLDSTNSCMIMDIFTALNREGITIFLVTHEPDIASYAKRQLKLFDGKIVYDEVKQQDN